jgi:hypothetical protein
MLRAPHNDCPLLKQVLIIGRSPDQDTTCLSTLTGHQAIRNSMGSTTGFSALLKPPVTIKLGTNITPGAYGTAANTLSVKDNDGVPVEVIRNLQFALIVTRKSTKRVQLVLMQPERF